MGIADCQQILAPRTFSCISTQGVNRRLPNILPRGSARRNLNAVCIRPPKQELCVQALDQHVRVTNSSKPRPRLGTLEPWHYSSETRTRTPVEQEDRSTSKCKHSSASMPYLSLLFLLLFGFVLSSARSFLILETCRPVAIQGFC